MRTHAISAVVILATLVACGLARGEWFEYSPAGSVNGQGSLREVLSRCAKASYFESKYRGDPVGIIHEAVHEVHAQMDRRMQMQALYLGNGQSIVLPVARIQLATVGQYVPAQYRDREFYRHYLGTMTAPQYGNANRPFYVLDEWVAAYWGWRGGLESGGNYQADRAMALQFCHFADALVEAVRRHDPSYPRLNELARFVEWQKKRTQQMAGGRQLAGAR